MSIKLINIDEFKQDFEVSQKNKSFYGEVRTDFKLIDKMLNLIPQSLFYLPHKRKGWSGNANKAYLQD